MRRLHEGEKIGQGYYKEVFSSKENPDQLVANFREPLGNDQIKSAFYLGKIAHILFPENVPDIHAAFNDGGNKSTLYLENAHPDEEHKQHAKYRSMGIRDNEKARLGIIYDKKNKRDPEVIKLIKRMNSLGLQPDENGSNFGRSSDGNVMLMDTDPGYINIFKRRALNFIPDLLQKAIEDLPEGAQKQQALNYFVRLTKLTAEEKEEEVESTEE